jgi:hypothetical protein
MSQRSAPATDFSSLATAVANHCEKALDQGILSAIADDDLSKTLVAAMRVFAAKAQTGVTPALIQGNHGLSATDGAIAATAILEAIGIEVFELAAWQACSKVGSRRHEQEDMKGGQ